MFSFTDSSAQPSEDRQALQQLEQSAGFEILPCETRLDFEDKNRFLPLELGASQKMSLSALASQMPAALSAGALANAYTVRFPQGLPHVLTALDQGGYAAMIRGAKGRFIGSASFYPMAAQAALMGAFTAMSVVSSQYFLKQIHSEMQVMNLKLDEILEFLYGDKKAELLAEMSFIRYAYQNFTSIMAHDVQRSATLISLQEAKKVAMKDIEFYIGDLDATVSRKVKDFSELTERTGKAFQLRESLNLSEQLFIMSSMLEAYYAQNLEAGYLSALESDMLSYIDKCDKRTLASFSTLKGQIAGYKAKPMEKVDKSTPDTRITSVIDALNNGAESSTRKAVRTALHAASKPAEYYLTQEGKIYIKA